MSARSKIIDALVAEYKNINGTSLYESNLHTNVFNKLKFWNEVDDYPSVYLNAGPETREYLPGGFKWGYLTAIIRIYVKAEEPESELEKIFSDIEIVTDSLGKLEYDTGKFTEDINIISINTDEGLLAPIGVGEITLQIMYDIESN
jgi:hypothetical protein